MRFKNRVVQLCWICTARRLTKHLQFSISHSQHNAKGNLYVVCVTKLQILKSRETLYKYYRCNDNNREISWIEVKLSEYDMINFIYILINIEIKSTHVSLREKWNINDKILQVHGGLVVWLISNINIHYTQKTTFTP